MDTLTLPARTATTRKLTFTVPHILKSITQDRDGFIHRDVREGGDRQVDFETVIEYSENEVPREGTFAIRATNQLNFAGSVINVINDAVDLPGLTLVPTSPTASEYLRLVGTPVLVSFSCVLDPMLTKQFGKPIYKTGRVFLVLLP